MCTFVMCSHQLFSILASLQEQNLIEMIDLVRKCQIALCDSVSFCNWLDKILRNCEKLPGIIMYSFSLQIFWNETLYMSDEVFNELEYL